MTHEIMKQIANVTINYEDGTRDTMHNYALVGLSGDTWFRVMLCPAKNSAKIKMNNMLAELSGNIISSIEKEQ